MTSHYLNQCWPDSLTHICSTRVRWVNRPLINHASGVVMGSLQKALQWHPRAPRHLKSPATATWQFVQKPVQAINKESIEVLHYWHSVRGILSTWWIPWRKASNKEVVSMSGHHYSISQEICTRFCCALLCCGYAIVHNEFTWSIYPYSSGLLCWHWGNR